MKRHLRAASLAALAGAGCTQAQEPTRLPVEAAASAPAASVAVAAAPVPKPIETGPLAWGTRPPARADLYPHVDGQCIHMMVWPLDGGSAVVTYGNPQGSGYRRGSSATYAYFGAATGLEKPFSSGSASDPSAILGRKNHLYVVANEGSRSYSKDTLYLHDGTTATSVVSKPGEVVLSITPALTHEGAPFFSVDDGTSTKLLPGVAGAKPPAALGQLKAPQRAHVLGDGTIVAMSEGVHYRIPPGGKPIKLTTSLLDSLRGLVGFGFDVHTRSSAITGNAMWLLEQGPSTSLVRVDKDKEERVTLPGSHRPVEVQAGPQGSVYVRTEAFFLYRIDAARTITEVAQHVHGFLVNTKGTLWTFDKAGALFEQSAGSTSAKPLAFPDAPFAATGTYKAERLELVDDDLVVSARYIEKGYGWREPEPYRALLTRHRPSEVLRCPDAPTGQGSGEGFESWPPKADASCKTPVVLWYPDKLAGLDGYAVGPKSDYKMLRGLLAKDAPKGTLIEVMLGSRRYVAQKVASAEEGQRLAVAVGKKNAWVRPQIVCGELPAMEREIPIAPAK